MRHDVPQLVISTSPYLKRQVETPAVMRHVLYALAPVVLASVYYFGISAFLVVVSCVLGATLTEWVFTGRGSLGESHVADGSAIVTAVLLALTLPPGIPLWMAFLGAMVAITVGKILFGGLGHNVFNPSLTGRAFLQASFPVAITTWSAHSNLGGFFQLRGDTFALPFTTPNVDAVTTATPLAKMKFEHTPTEVTDLLFGQIPGSMGETCAVLILLGGIYLAYRRFLQWQIPVSILATVAVFATILHLINADKFPGPLHHLLSGGLMLGAVFMATDPVTSPITPRGAMIFGAGVGILVVLIRQFGAIPEGVMYAILLMNGATPLIDRYTQPKIYGAERKKKEEKTQEMSNGTNHTPPPVAAALQVPQPSSLRMVLTMGGIGLFCGVLIVLTFQLTLPTITVNKARALEKAIFDVIPAATTKTAFKQVGDELEPLEGEDPIAIKYFAGYDDEGRLVGVALEAAGQGFQDIVTILYGYSSECKCVIGMKVMASKETPGLGTKIETDPNFRANFDALSVALDGGGEQIANPIVLVKPGKKTDSWQIEAITGATISSRAIADILEKSTAARIPVIERNLDILEGGAP